MRLTVGEILDATGGQLVRGSKEAVVTGVSTDSRTVRKGQLFVALRGDKHDGHDHLREVHRKGVPAAIVDRRVKTPTKNLIRVKDTLRALGDLAYHWRRRFPIQVVAVTGSNGKTTAKDMIAQVLATRYRVLKTEGNFNNLIGLPLTVFRLRGGEEIAVLEMGMNRPGEIDRLAEIAAPSVGVITNVARAHLEGLGGLAGVAKAKGELLDRLTPGGLAVLNRDDRFFNRLKKRALRHRARVVSFGAGSGSDYRAVEAKTIDLKGLRFTAILRGRRTVFRMPVIGRHNVSNALAALAVGDRFEVPVAKMRGAIGRFRAMSKRMEVVTLPRGTAVINDCYNANPDSMAASLDFLKEAAGRRRTVAVLGDMLELGSAAAEAHREVGVQAARAGVSLLVAAGPHAKEVVAGARRAGLPPARGFVVNSAEASIPLVRSLVRPGDIVLIKGSRGMKMERVTEGLQAREGTH